MKILYLITKSEIGGAQTHVQQLMEHMMKNGHQVVLVCAPDGWLVDEAEKIGVTVYPNKYFKHSYNPFVLYRAYRAIKKTIADFNPELVHCHSSFAGFLGRLAIRGCIPTIFTAHSWAFTEGTKPLRKIIAPIAERIVAPYTDKIICVSEYDRQLALRYHIARAGKLITIHNGIPIKLLVEKKQNNQVEVISIGRLAYPKEYVLLINAFKLLPKDTQAHLTIVGGGQLRDTLRHEIGDRDSITLAGQKSPDEVQALLHNSDIFILLSKHEGFPMTILEAMIAGLPVIASRVGGIPEQIDTSSGILVENTKQDVVQALVTLISDKDICSTMSVQAHTRVQTLFSLEQFLQKTEAVYREVLTKRAS